MRHGAEVAAQTGSAWPYAQAAWVFSTRKLPEVPGANVHFVRGRVIDHFAAMRSAAGSGNLWIVGGGDLAGQFLDAGLLDELIVQVGSVTLGRGKPLLPRRVLSPSLSLTSIRRLSPAMAELRYEVLKAAR